MFMRDGTPSGFSTMSTGRPSAVVRHVLDRHDHRHHALVAVAAGHLVARLDAALHGQVHLDHLQHARREVVARGDLGLLVLEALVELFLVALDLLLRALEELGGVLVLHADREPLVLLQAVEVLVGDLGALLQAVPGRRWRPCRPAACAGGCRSRLRGCGTGRRSPS